MRSPRLALALLVAGGVLNVLPTTGAVAVDQSIEQTCRGLPATIVGTPGADLTGTTGADVVVTNGAVSVDTGDGDDVVCTTATKATVSSSGVQVLTGSGDDTVDTTADGSAIWTSVDLGDGDDTFEGGRARDSVDARDEGHDTVTTGGGNDQVATGGASGLDEDVVDAGASGDQLLVDGALGPAAHVSGGAGHDDLNVTVPSAGRWVFDNRSEEVRHDGMIAWRWAGVERFVFGQLHTVGRISFIGGPVDELLYASTAAFAGARLGGGNDMAFVASPRLRGSPALRAGAGRDGLSLLPYGTDQPVDRAALDLAARSLTYVDRGRRTTLTVTGFETADLHARSVRMAGTAARDSMTGWACDAELSGRGGDDFLALVAVGECGAGTRLLRGGSGADRMYGSGLADLLAGGPGTDRADGGDGRDTCAAETTTSCEVTDR